MLHSTRNSNIKAPTAEDTASSNAKPKATNGSNSNGNTVSHATAVMATPPAIATAAMAATATMATPSAIATTAMTTP